MQPTTQISSDIPYRADSLDYTRVEERASHDYFREFWSSYKGHVRGMLMGLAIGALVGGVIGLVVASMLPEAAAIVAFGAFAGVGALIGADEYGAVGSAAASRAAGLAEKHARMIDPVHQGNELSALSDKLMMDGRGHNFQYPVDRDNGKLYKWKSGLLGAALGTGLGALIAGTTFATLFPVGVPVALALGTLGLTFGIDRSRLKSIFNHVDANADGKLSRGSQGPDLGRSQFGVIESNAQIADHRLRRQESTFALEEEYHTKIYASGVKGLFRGAANGIVAGALIGAVVGMIAFGTAAVFGIPLAAGVTFAAVTTGFAGAGALYGMSTFGEAGREAGAESTARAIDNEFERNQQLRERGITPEAKEPAKGNYFSLKAALIMGAIGVGVGLLVPGVLALAAIKLAGATALATSLAATSPAALATSATVFGALGATFGARTDSVKKLSQATDWLYDKSYVVHNDPTSRPYVATGPAVPELTAANSKTLQNSITSEDMSALQTRMDQRPQKNFEQSVLAQQTQPAAHSM